MAAMLERVSSLAEKFTLVNLRARITACEGLLKADHGIDVAVLGRFKAGKSSFLNHLAGRDVLPIGVIPLKLFRRPIQQVLLRKARWEVEKNLSRLAADWGDRVAAGINELTHVVEQQALDELTALEQTLAQTASRTPELRRAIDDLEECQFRLRAR
jgi:hypothetical protein